MLIFIVSCSHSERQGDLYKTEEVEPRSFGLLMDPLSLSSLNQGTLEKRGAFLKKKETSSDILSEALFLDILSGEAKGDVPENLMRQLEKENISQESRDPYYYRILIAYIKKKDFPKAFYFLSKLFVSTSNLYKAKAYNVQGVLDLLESKKSEALSSFEEAYRLDQKDESVRLNLAFLKFEYGLFEESQKVLEGDLKHPVGIFFREMISQIKNKKPISLDSCESYVTQFPKNKIFLYNCGQIAYYEYNDISLAKKWLKESLSLNQEFEEIDKKTKMILAKISG
jgi:tetratricopeptide (TPR) repeat protein